MKLNNIKLNIPNFLKIFIDLNLNGGDTGAHGTQYPKFFVPTISHIPPLICLPPIFHIPNCVSPPLFKFDKIQFS